MSMEDAGGAVTGGLIAAAIERPTGQAGEHDAVCSDCGAETQGNFCSNCGQPTHLHRSLFHLAEEVLHGVMHFDARIWRTLPLLFLNPGRLTREWVQGRRTRYISPLAIFLFTVFVIFFVLSFARMPEPVMSQAARTAVAEQGLARAEQRLQEARNRLEAANASGVATPGAAEAIALAQSRLAEAEAEVAADTQALGERRAAIGTRDDGLAPGGWQAGLKDWAAGIYASPDANDREKALAKKLMNPDLAVYKLQQTFYKFAFLLVPLSIPFMWLLFAWRRGVTLYDHGVFVLYSLTFMAIAFTATMGLALFGPVVGGLATTALMIGAPVHVFAQLKGAYDLGWWSTIWRYVLLLMFCVMALSLFIGAVMLVAVT